MLVTKLKMVVGAFVVMGSLSTIGLAYRASSVQAQPPQGKPPTELEMLRKENELLKLNLQVVLEKVRIQESELRDIRKIGNVPAQGVRTPSTSSPAQYSQPGAPNPYSSSSSPSFARQMYEAMEQQSKPKYSSPAATPNPNSSPSSPSPAGPTSPFSSPAARPPSASAHQVQVDADFIEALEGRIRAMRGPNNAARPPDANVRQVQVDYQIGADNVPRIVRVMENGAKPIEANAPQGQVDQKAAPSPDVIVRPVQNGVRPGDPNARQVQVDYLDALERRMGAQQGAEAKNRTLDDLEKEVQKLKSLMNASGDTVLIRPR